MKASLVIVLFLCMHFSYAQETSSIIYLTTPVEMTVYEPLSTIHVGEAVLLHVKTSVDIDIKNVQLVTEDAEVSREGDDFLVIAKKTGTITLRFYDYSLPEKPTLIETKTLTAKLEFKSSGPRAGLNGKTGGRITHSELLHAGELTLMNYSADKTIEDTAFKIVNFKMSVFSKDKDPVLDLKSAGSKITPEMKEVIKSYPKGSKVYFEYIKAQLKSSSDQSTRSLPPLSFVLVDDQ